MHVATIVLENISMANRRQPFILRHDRRSACQIKPCLSLSQGCLNLLKCVSQTAQGILTLFCWLVSFTADCTTVALCYAL